jgi:hypothetical protein
MKFATYWLLAVLTAPTALAQTHSEKKDIHENFFQHTQPATLDPNPVYTYVEQMPTLNGQSGFAVITTAIQQRLMLPSAAPVGRAFVQFVVTKEGAVTKPQIVKGLRADVDSAVVAATRKLPRFEPGKQAGWAVAVSYTLAVPIGAPVGAKPGEASSKK